MSDLTMKLVECDLRPVLSRLERTASKRQLRESEEAGVPPYSEQVVQQSEGTTEEVSFSAKGKCIKGWIKDVGNGKFKFLLHLENDCPPEPAPATAPISAPMSGPQEPANVPTPSAAPAPEPIEVDSSVGPDALLNAMLSTIYSLIA